MHTVPSVSIVNVYPLITHPSFITPICSFYSIPPALPSPFMPKPLHLALDLISNAYLTLANPCRDRHSCFVHDFHLPLRLLEFPSLADSNFALSSSLALAPPLLPPPVA